MKFIRPKNSLEGYGGRPPDTVAAPEPAIVCTKCKKNLTADELDAAFYVCRYCRRHFTLSARRRIRMMADGGTFVETDADLQSRDVLGFPGYERKLEAARLKSSENDSVVCGRCEIGGNPAAIFVMEPNFMMGSMGGVTGEKITRTFEDARERKLPVVGFTASGGARMQEGMISLMQMAKTCGAVKRHGDGGNLFICVLTDPTTGGVTASFAMSADIILAEPDALIGFAGPRVTEQTIRKKLPEGFQRAEFQLKHGFIDRIADRGRQKSLVSLLLRMHRREGAV